MTKFRIVIVVVFASLLLSCSSRPQQEQNPQGKKTSETDELFSVKKLFVDPNGRAALELPPNLLATASDKVKANSSSKGAAQVLPEVIGATVRTEKDNTWLEIDADVEVVWRKLTEFWAFQEIELSDYQAQAGLMETDWFAKIGNTSARGIAAGFLKGLIARRTALDKYTMRLQRNTPSGTNLFVTHRRRERITKEPNSNKKIAESHWVERESDPEKVAQLLQTIVLLFDNRQHVSTQPASDSKTP